MADASTFYDGTNKPSHFIQITEITQDDFTIRLDVLEKLSKKTKYKIMLNNEWTGETIKIKKKTIYGECLIDFDGEHEQYEISVYSNNDEPISFNSINIIDPSKNHLNRFHEFDLNYKPNCIDTSTIVQILDKNDEHIHLYWNTPSATFGQIGYKIIYHPIDDNDKKQNNYDVSHFDECIIQKLPLSIPLFSIPISIQIITISTMYSMKNHMLESDPTDIIDIGWDRKTLQKQQDEKLESMVESEINKQIDEQKIFRFTPVIQDLKSEYNDVPLGSFIYPRNMLHSEDNMLYSKHRSVLEQWNENSMKLKINASNKKKMVIEKHNDDEKKSDGDSFGVQLFSKYSEIYTIITEQSNRLSQITTDNYLLELINHQNLLSPIIIIMKQQLQKHEYCLNIAIYDCN
eukprot:493507_1